MRQASRSLSSAVAILPSWLRGPPPLTRSDSGAALSNVLTLARQTYGAIYRAKPAQPRVLRVAVLVDLPRSPQSGGHVKCWERFAAAAAQGGLPLDLTVYYSGDQATESLGPNVRLRHLPPVFSTARLTFLPYTPDTTDLAPFHPALAQELSRYDVVHTTDGFFAFAQTAAYVSRLRGIPLTTSFHTDTPAYARIFTRETVDKMFARWPTVRDALVDDWRVPERQAAGMERRLRRHVRACQFAMVTRIEDHALSEAIIGVDRVRHLRLGADKDMFSPHRRDRAGVERDYRIPAGRIVTLFVGRVDVGKNIHTLTAALKRLIAEGIPIHLIVAGVGPASEHVRRELQGHVSLPGYVPPAELARLYASVDGLALSSEVEIRSMAGVEAMASGCPVLVSEKSGVAPLFQRTAAMQTVESGADNWADALRGFAADPARQRRMRRDAAVYSRDFLSSWQEVLSQDLFSVWRKVAGARRQQFA